MINTPVPVLSIAIPSYNRPTSLIKLLESIDSKNHDLFEVVICEDFSPRRKEVIENFEKFRFKSEITLNFILNNQNLGYDKNLKQLIKHCKGTYVLFMGDDDTFYPKAIDKLIPFLIANQELGYILRRYLLIHQTKSKEDFRYYAGTTFLNSGQSSYYELFRKSVFISGFCFKREFAKNLLIDDFDGTLLFQLYLVAEISLNYPTAYFDQIISVMDESKREVPEFGSSVVEQTAYTPGLITLENSINFLKGFFKIARFIDSKYNLHSESFFRRDFSKYSYQILAIQRSEGWLTFSKYAYKLIKEVSLGKSIYFYIYYFGLLILKKNTCDSLIISIKRLLGRTPQL